MEKRARIATVASFMAMSGRATLTDPATNGAADGTDGEFTGQIKKAQPISEQQLKRLQEENTMD